MWIGPATCDITQFLERDFGVDQLIDIGIYLQSRGIDETRQLYGIKNTNGLEKH